MESFDVAQSFLIYYILFQRSFKVVVQVNKFILVNLE